MLLEKHNGADAEACVPRRAQAGRRQPRRPRRPGAGGARRPLRRRRRARGDRARAGGQPGATPRALALRARAGPRRRGLARPPRPTWPSCAAPTRATPGGRALAAAARAAARRSRRLRARARRRAGGAPARRRVLRVRRRGADRATAATTRRAPSPPRASPPIPTTPRCLAVLATTLLRLGDEAAGLDALRRAWKRDPVRRPHLQPAEPVREGDPAATRPSPARTCASGSSPPRAPRSRRWSRRSSRSATRDYVARYGFEPPGPVTFELYGDPRDYAVRTVGPARHRRRRRLLRPGDHVAVARPTAPSTGAWCWRTSWPTCSRSSCRARACRAGSPRGCPSWRPCAPAPGVAAPRRRRRSAAPARGELPPLVDLSTAFVTRARRRGRGRAPTRTSAVAVDFLERRFGFAGRCARRWRRSGGASASAAVLERLAGMPVAALDGPSATSWRSGSPRYDGQYLRARSLRAPRRASCPGTSATPRATAGAGGDRPGRARAGDSRPRARGAGRGALAARRQGPPPDDQAATLFLTGEIALARARRRARPWPRSRGCWTLDPAARRLRRARAAGAGRDPPQATRPPPRRHLRRAIDLRSDARRAARAAGRALRRQQRTADRLVELEAALRLEPQTDAVAKEVVLGRRGRGASARVVELGPIAIFIDPADPDLHAALGRALAATGKPAAGGRALRARRSVFVPATHARRLTPRWQLAGPSTTASGDRRQGPPPTAPPPAPAS